MDENIQRQECSSNNYIVRVDVIDVTTYSFSKNYLLRRTRTDVQPITHYKI